MNQSSNRKLEVQVLKPIFLLGACFIFAAIGILIFYWVALDKKERHTIENFLTKTSPEKSINEKNNYNTDLKVITPRPEKTEDVAIRTTLPDELILGMSRIELDAFHKRQHTDISKQLSNSQTKVELPPSDDILPAITLHDLNALHKQQTIVSKSKRTEIFEPPGDGTNEDKASVTTLDELDSIHKEQSIQAKPDDKTVELPAVSSENEFQPLTIDQLDEMHSRQQLAADFSQVDDTKPLVLPPSVDGPPSLTNWGLIELHAQQEELSNQ